MQSLGPSNQLSWLSTKFSLDNSASRIFLIVAGIFSLIAAVFTALRYIIPRFYRKVSYEKHPLALETTPTILPESPTNQRVVNIEGCKKGAISEEQESLLNNPLIAEEPVKADMPLSSASSSTTVDSLSIVSSSSSASVQPSDSEPETVIVSELISDVSEPISEEVVETIPKRSSKEILSFEDFQERRSNATLRYPIGTPLLSASEIRSDAQPLKDESIEHYLERVFSTYIPKEDMPKGFVFAGFDFAYRLEGVHPAIFFLNQYMDALQRIGIKKIFFEQTMGYTTSGDEQSNGPYTLYRYFREEQAEMPSWMQSRMNMKLICEAAKGRGMEVIGAEYCDYNQRLETRGGSDDRRLHHFNGLSSALIAGIGEPFVVFVGAAHGKARRGYAGLADLLGCPCIGLLSTSLQPAVLPGTHSFTERAYSVDAIFAE